MRKFSVILILFMVTQCALEHTARAQSPSNCVPGVSLLGFGGGIPLGWPCSGWITAPIGLDFCTFPPCAPPEAKDETRCPCKDGQPVAVQPVSLGNGNTYIEENDLRIPGLSNGLTLDRTWNSQWPAKQATSAVGMFGLHWRSTYEERVWPTGDGYMKYARSNGTFWTFIVTQVGWSVIAPGNGGATLQQINNPTTGLPWYWKLVLKNGEQRHFDINSGCLTAIIDRNNNETQMTYDSSNRLVDVTDPAQRTLTFTYANSNNSFLATSVSSSVGMSLTYAYDAQGRLTQVTYPDQTTLTFQYDANSNITAVLDSNGKVLESHTYDSNRRAVTSSRANGVEAITISYQ